MKSSNRLAECHNLANFVNFEIILFLFWPWQNSSIIDFLQYLGHLFHNVQTVFFVDELLGICYCSLQNLHQQL
jgi:hypothetical protein